MAMVSGWLRLSLVASNIKVTRVYNKEGDANASPSLLKHILLIITRIISALSFF